MKIALVHDFLNQEGGAEKVLRVFSEIFPEAPIYTMTMDKNRAGKLYIGKDVRTSFIQKMPLGVKKYQWFLPLMPTAVERFDLTAYDIILSDASAFAKGVITKPDTLHICYCYTPTRYLWMDTHSYVKEVRVTPLVKWAIPYALNKIRIWDRVAADRVDKFIAISNAVKRRIKKYYQRESDVIFPPVDTKEFSIADKIEDYYLIGGRLVSYKRYDLAIQAFNRLGMKLKIFGEGPEYKRLKNLAKKNIEFVGRPDSLELADLYKKAIAFIHPQDEDFGITPVESMASGRPAIAYARGGALDTIIDGKTGKFFEDQTWEALGDTIIRFKPEDFKPEEIRRHALLFDTESFKKNIKQFIENNWEQFSIEHRQKSNPFIL